MIQKKDKNRLGGNKINKPGVSKDNALW